MRTRSIAFFAVLAATAGGCSAQPNAPDIIQGVKTAKAAYSIGLPMTITYGIKNRGAAPVTFDFPSSKQYDVWATLGGKEVYRLSRGRSYADAMTSITLQPGEIKTFEVSWDQRDSSGNQIAPGVYELSAQLTPTGTKPPATKCRVQVGGVGPAITAVTVSEAIKGVDALKGRMVEIAAVYKGWEPDPTDPNTKPGPPLTRSDWAICDSTGCMYVHGKAELDPSKDLGTKVDVSGTLHKTDTGQVYMLLRTATVVKP